MILNDMRDDILLNLGIELSYSSDHAPNFIRHSFDLYNLLNFHVKCGFYIEFGLRVK